MAAQALSAQQSPGELLSDFARFAGARGALALLLVGLGALLEGAGIVLLIPLVEILSPGAAGGRWPMTWLYALVPDEALPRLLLVLGAFGGLVLARAGVLHLRDALLARLRIGFIHARQFRIISALAAAPWATVTRLQHARITHLLSADVERCGMAIYALLQAAVALVAILIQAGIAFALSPLVAAACFVLLAAAGLSMLSLVRRAREMGARASEDYAMLAQQLGQFLGGLKLAVSQNRQRAFVDAFSARQQSVERLELAFVKAHSRARNALSLLAAAVAGVALILGYGVAPTPPAVLVAILLILARMAGPVMQLQQGLHEFARSLPAYGAMKQLERELGPETTAGDVVGPDGEARPGPVAFHRVTYLHDEGEGGGGVRELDLLIRPGEWIGLAGPSGAGKTTLADLLTGLLRPQAGEILVAGEPLTERKLKSWREQLSYLPQDPFLFHDSVRRNLLWARPEAREEELWACLAIAGADDVVRRMPAGLETVVGERGSLVSGGERQRIALARALLRKPKLLVLDEATSALDPDLEREVLVRVRRAYPELAALVIAHSRDTLALCSSVLRLDGGRIASVTTRESPAPPRRVAG